MAPGSVVLEGQRGSWIVAGSETLLNVFWTSRGREELLLLLPPLLQSRDTKGKRRTFCWTSTSTSSLAVISPSAETQRSSNSSLFSFLLLFSLITSFNTCSSIAGVSGVCPSSSTRSPHSHLARRSRSSSTALSATTLTRRTFSPSGSQVGGRGMAPPRLSGGGVRM